jgi:tetratricopeptide (TPR) repeat protein
VLTPEISSQPELMRAYCAIVQLHEPWSPINNEVHRVLEWRLFFPVLCHYLHVPDRLFLCLPDIGCLATLTLAGWMIWRETTSIVVTAATLLILSTSSWFFVSTGWLGYFDAWVIFALFIAAFLDSRPILIITGLIAPWIDERFIFALPLCLAIRTLRFNEPGSRVWPQLWREGAAFLPGTSVYFVARFTGETLHFRNTAAQYAEAGLFFSAPLAKLSRGLWEGLRLGWLVVIAGIFCAVRLDRARGLAICGGVFLSLTTLLLAADISRSASIVVALVVAGVTLAWRIWPRVVSFALPAIAIGQLLLPARHVVASFDVPITNFRNALALQRNKPAIINPLAYNAAGVQAFAANDYAKARVAFETAVALAPHLAEARVNLGVVLFVTGDRIQGMRELDRVLLDDPDLHLARLARAKLRHAVGDHIGALADLQELHRRTGPDWTGWSEARQVEAQLSESKR